MRRKKVSFRRYIYDNLQNTECEEKNVDEMEKKEFLWHCGIYYTIKPINTFILYRYVYIKIVVFLYNSRCGSFFFSLIFSVFSSFRFEQNTQKLRLSLHFTRFRGDYVCECIFFPLNSLKKKNVLFSFHSSIGFCYLLFCVVCCVYLFVYVRQRINSFSIYSFFFISAIVKLHAVKCLYFC